MRIHVGRPKEPHIYERRILTTEQRKKAEDRKQRLRMALQRGGTSEYNAEWNRMFGPDDSLMTEEPTV